MNANKKMMRYYLLPFSQMMVKIEQVSGNISNALYLCKNCTRVFLFFYLFFHEPLEHIKGCVILFLDRKVDKSVDHGSDLLFMGVDFLKHFTSRRPFCFGCFDIKETGFSPRAMM